jgi:isopenicillin N synthase-like dioxygenase
MAAEVKITLDYRSLPIAPGIEACVADISNKGWSLFALGDDLQRKVSIAYEAAEAFFDLDEKSKQACVLPYGCGYTPFGREHSGNPALPDRVEIFAASARTHDLALDLPCAAGCDLHARMMEVSHSLEMMAEDIMRGVARTVALGVSEQKLTGGLHRWSQLQFNRTILTEPGQFINTAHEDGHLLTFAHANGRGLEIVTGSSVLEPDSTNAAFTVMPGAILSLLTGGEIRPLYHQVRAHSRSEHRLSLLFFADLDPQLCEPWKITPANRDIDIASRVLGNARRFGMDGFPPD